MPLRLVRSRSNEVLWRTCVGRFLSETGNRTGPAGYPSFLWITHRIQRDALYRVAAARGLRGWLAPPVAFLSELPREFDLRLPPIGSLQRRMIISRIAARHGARLGIRLETAPDRRGPDAAVDALIGDFLAEGLSTEAVASALREVEDDDFARRRNEWVAASYRDYVDHLERVSRFDPRAIHGYVADRIAHGHLRAALRGAGRLHIFGVHSPAARRRLFRALAEQPDVDVSLYLPVEPEESEWDRLDATIAELPGEPDALAVQPAPDERREMEFVAGEVKRLLVEDRVPPHQIAVVARTGRDDARRAYEVLEWAGIPTTARIRTPLAEVPALKVILQLLRGAALGWTYRPLRHVLESAYFDLDVDLRSIDYLARHARLEGLDEWSASVERLAARAASDEERQTLIRDGLFEDRLGADRAAITAFAEQAAVLATPRDVTDWITLTRSLLDPGWFDFRKRLCRQLRDDWQIVRLDQRAVDLLDRLLSEWREEDTATLGADAWYARLRRFLRSNEIALTTPRQTGVQVLEAHEAALFPFRHTFVVHANDGTFPRRIAAGTLFSEDERARLFAAGLPIPPRDVALRRERTLWRAVTQGPAVTITYRTADANGVPLLPSLMIDDPAPERQIPRTQFTWDRAFNRAHDELIGARRLAACVRDAAGRVTVADPRPLRRAVVHAVAETERRGGPEGSGVIAGEPGPWNGLIRDPAVLEVLARRFGAERPWSASQLELYAQCPFIFFAQRVLYLDDLAEVEDDTTALVLGSVGHDILERFYSQYAGPFPGELAGDALALLDQITETVFREREDSAGDWLGRPVLWEVSKLGLREKIETFVEWELPRLVDRRPCHTEFEFGFGRPYRLTGTDVRGMTVELLLRGRVDRVDVSNDGCDHHVLDYKLSSTPTSKSYQDGSVLQAPLYMRAAADTLGVRVAAGGYTALKRDYWTKRRTVAGEVRWGNKAFERAIAIALSVPTRVRAGYFEARVTGHLKKWKLYWTGTAAARTDAYLSEGCRFDA